MHQSWTELLVIVVIALLLLWIGSAIRRFTANRSRPTPPLSDAFQDIEFEAAALRFQVDQGKMSESLCRERMRELMIQDANGNWWMVGYESGSWYRHDGNDWVRADPPR